VRFFILAVFMVLSAPVCAAGIDCSKATTERENAICAEPRLLKDDQRNAEAYAAALAKLSDEGRKLLLQSQRQWLEYVDKSCKKGSGTDSIKTYQRCLQSALDARLGDLQESGKKSGPFVIIQLPIYNVDIGDQELYLAGNREGRSEFVVSYPHIDDEKSPQVRAFNDYLKQLAKSQSNDCDSGESGATIRVGAAAENLASLSISSGGYCYGRPHGSDGESAILVDFVSEPRILDSKEVFSSDQKLRDQMVDLFHNKLSIGDRSYKDADLSDDTLKGLDTAALDVASWWFKPDGLEFMTSSYQGGCYVCVVNVEKISWSEILPFIKSDSPARRLR